MVIGFYIDSERHVLTAGDKVQFKDGRGNGRVFVEQSVNDKTFLPPFKDPQRTVELEFQAFGTVAVLRRCKKDLLEVVT